MKDFYQLLHCLGVGLLQVKFEEVFSKHATHKDALTLGDIFRMIYANRNVFDPFGWTATVLEWGALYWVAADDDVRSFPFLFPIPLPLAASTTLELGRGHLHSFFCFVDTDRSASQFALRESSANCT